MNLVTINKTISQVPTPLTPSTIYAVRTGLGFDLFISDATGQFAHKVNDPVPVLSSVGGRDQTTDTHIYHGWNRSDGSGYVAIAMLIETGDRVGQASGSGGIPEDLSSLTYL